MASKSNTPLTDKLKKSGIPKLMQRLMQHTGTADPKEIMHHFDVDEEREGYPASQLDEEPAPLNQEEVVKTPNSLFHKITSMKKKPNEISETVEERGVSATPLSDRLAKSGIAEKMNRMVSKNINEEPKSAKELLREKLKKKKVDLPSMEKINVGELKNAFSKLMNKS